MKKYIILIILLILPIFIFCSNSTQNGETNNPENQNVNMENSALLIVHIQEATCPLVNEETLLKNIKKLIEKAKKSNRPVIFAQRTTDDEKFKEGSAGWQIKEEIRPEGEYLGVNKKDGSAFRDTNLEELLTSLKVDTLVICGSSSQFCLNLTIVDAFNIGYTVIVPSDAHSAPTRYKESSIENMNKKWKELGVIIKSTDSINF